MKKKADEELAQKLQAEERGKFSGVEKARLLVEMINKRKRLFAQQRAKQRRNKPMTQAQQRTYMCNYIKNMGSHTLQQLKKLSFDEIKELFETTMKRVKDFVPMESDRLVPKISTGSSKRTAETELEHEGSKRQKTNEEQSAEEEKELSEEELQKLMMIVPVEEVYVEALQVKYPIIDWEVYSEDTRKYWKIIRVGNHTEAYQTFDDMLKKFDRDDLDKLWSLVKERFSSTDPTDDKERTLWVELKRLFEPDIDDILWKLQRYMHDPLTWRLYDTCGVHHVSTDRGHDIFMLVEKDYPLTRGILTLMLCNKLQVDQYSEMANELLKKIFILANRPRQGGLLGIKGFYKFLLLVQLSTAKRRLSTAKLTFGRHLEEIHTLWIEFGKKRDKIATLPEDDQELAYSAWRWWIPSRKTVETCINTNDSALPLGKETCTPNTVICANLSSLSTVTNENPSVSSPPRISADKEDGGLDVCVDLTGSSSLTQTEMVDFLPGRAVIDATQRKRGKYMAKCAAIGYGFLPFSFSSLGELETDAVTLLKRIRKFFMAQEHVLLFIYVIGSVSLLLKEWGPR
ncbi:hypothetical protein Tco_0001714 [Tanacetum coccineum]